MKSSQALVALALSLSAAAHPTPEESNDIVERANSLALDSLRTTLVSEYVTSKDVSSSIVNQDYVKAANDLVKSKFPKAQFRQVNDNYVSSDGIGHVNFKQTVFGIDIDNADYSVHVAPDGSIFSHSNSFYTGSTPLVAPVVSALLGPLNALKTAVSQLGLPLNLDAARASLTGQSFTVKGVSGVLSDPTGRLVYHQSAGSLVPAWKVETDIGNAWLNSYVSAEGPSKVLSVVNYVADAQYNVYPWPLVSPAQGSRSLQTNPYLTSASPYTWQGDGTNNYIDTRGNNGFAQPNVDGDANYLNEPRPTNAQQVFNFPLDLTKEPDTYINASTVQLFYTANRYHDLLYLLGFNEAAGNFQQNNGNKGGKGNDYVILNTQDGSGTNNANFATPPDGSNGRMRMYIETLSTPKRDGSLDAGVVLHEYTHGLSTRLTGGPANSGCLNSLESGGMGEGWSDFFATTIRVKNTDTRNTNLPIGDYAFNRANGIRSYLYSTSKSTNPYTYSSLNSMNEVHQIGEVWAEILYEVLWNLIDARGNTAAINPTLDSKGVPSDGRYYALKVAMTGMSLQPCNPTFLQARDAILDADKSLTTSKYRCQLWTAFAKRGLGSGAVKNGSTYTDSFTVPSGVC